MLNQIVIVGRLVKDPELRETDSGKKVTILLLLFQEVIKMYLENMKQISLIVHYGQVLQKIQVRTVKKAIFLVLKEEFKQEFMKKMKKRNMQQK